MNSEVPTPHPFIHAKKKGGRAIHCLTSSQLEEKRMLDSRSMQQGFWTEIAVSVWINSRYFLGLYPL